MSLNLSPGNEDFLYYLMHIKSEYTLLWSCIRDLKKPHFVSNASDPMSCILNMTHCTIPVNFGFIWPDGFRRILFGEKNGRWQIQSDCNKSNAVNGQLKTFLNGFTCYLKLGRKQAVTSLILPSKFNLQFTDIHLSLFILIFKVFSIHNCTNF